MIVLDNRNLMVKGYNIKAISPCLWVTFGLPEHWHPTLQRSSTVKAAVWQVFLRERCKEEKGRGKTNWITTFRPWAVEHDWKGKANLMYCFPSGTAAKRRKQEEKPCQDFSGLLPTQERSNKVAWRAPKAIYPLYTLDLSGRTKMRTRHVTTPWNCQSKILMQEKHSYSSFIIKWTTLAKLSKNPGQILCNLTSEFLMNLKAKIGFLVRST